MLLLARFITPAVTSLKGGSDVTSAAYTVKGVLEQGRNYAMANNTYVWVGFFEESAGQASTSPATGGTGRVVLSIVASKDGTIVYNPNSLAPIDPTRLIQVTKLTKIDGIHLATFADGSGTPPADTFDTRPPVGWNTARIGDTTPPNQSLTSFQYPVGNPAPAAQYTFVKAIEFSPRGEARIDNSNYTYRQVQEVGLRPAHGTIAASNNPNVVALQYSAFGGIFRIYRR